MPERDDHWARVLEIGRALPDTEESTSYGTPALKVRGKLFARLWEDGEVLVVRVDLLERDALLASSADMFFLTPHYVNYPWILVRLAVVPLDELRELLADAWLLTAPPRLAAAFRSPMAE